MTDAISKLHEAIVENNVDFCQEKLFPLYCTKLFLQQFTYFPELVLVLIQSFVVPIEGFVPHENESLQNRINEELFSSEEVLININEKLFGNCFCLLTCIRWKRQRILRLLLMIPELDINVT